MHRRSGTVGSKKINKNVQYFELSNFEVPVVLHIFLVA